MNAGRMKQLVKVQKPVETQSATGEVTSSWETLGSAWASIEPVSGREAIQGGQAYAEGLIRVRMRHMVKMTTECRLVLPGRILEITQLNNIEDRNVEFEIMCREVV